MAAMLEFDSQGGAGTIVPTSGPAPAPAPAPTMHILVVDPDRASADLVRSVLGDADVRHAPDAYCALNDIESGPVDLIVIELCLPGASALEFLRRLRASGSHVPVVVFSHARGSDAVLRALGVTAVLAKSDPREALEGALRLAAPEIGTLASRRRCIRRRD